MADLEPLFRDNLEPDIAMWRKEGLDMARLEEGIKQNPDIDVVRLSLFYNNTFYMVREKDPRLCTSPCNNYLQDAIRAFASWTEEGIKFPNALFLFSMSDTPICFRMGRKECPAPILGPAKIMNHKDPATFPTSPDILIPKSPTKLFAHFVMFPWSKKTDKGFWRGTRWCDWGTDQYHVGCSRFYMGELMNSSSLARELIDFGYSAGDEATPISPYVNGDEFARFRFLLNLDGFTAAYRLSKLLLMNSVVLKEESFRGEYYYRSLKEYTHYLPIFKHNKTDVLDVIQEYRKPERQKELMAIMRAANRFSAKYCCPRARMLYWAKALQEYRTLFRDMDAAIESKWWPMVKAKVDAIGPLCKHPDPGLGMVPCKSLQKPA